MSASVALSATVTPASFTASVGDAAGNASTRQTAGTSRLDNTFATIGNSPISVQAHAEYASGVGTRTATAEVAYYFDLTGVTAGTVVPVLIGGDLWTMVMGDASAATSTARLTVTTPAGTTAQTVACSATANCSGSGANWSGTLTANAQAGAANLVRIRADASACCAGGVADAFADPYIAIDTTYKKAHPAVSVVVSPGVSNVFYSPAAAVPEPGTLGLVFAGLAAAAGAVASKRR